ncbi:efflux RND transporter periplasmic adaptor subunit [Roseospira marina]|uniref:Efflux RND transporter periplasmic adaptor subunit n=1 Tax=Roseospira marina TaxID=140057 RepID=A0A5M6IGT4_9PROT|nr:efflux RND transporter periplasmic adaptor subunit [Roseospira marina]KAA5606788.1 efflux RND transporter periplasmic adaptor subunit [Roseospira marina]MBB4313790.1 multidrug efflux system membrane fusion protein [Roseospira marina]MBB5086952.1 multidrug efflux system membrane fusion protein [Roseospira marina]
MRSSLLIAALIVLATVVWVASGIVGQPPDPSTTQAALQPPGADHRDAVVPRVRVTQLNAESRVATLSVLGATEASRTVEVRAETAGRVAEVGAEEGRAVETGSLLARLAKDDRMERLSRAEAAVARWEDRYKGDQRLANRDFTSRQRVLESKASLEDARATLAAMLLDIDRTEITAPFAGVVAERLVEEGDYVSIGEPIARIVDLDPLVVRAKLAEADIAQVHLGQPGTATLVTGRTLEGTVSFIAPVADGVTRTFAIELSVANPDPPVPEGMTADVTLPVDSRPAHRISPAVLGLDDDGRVGVKIVDDENRVVFYPVNLAGDDENGLWIEGLPDPATVIIVGQEFVRPGQIVEPVDTETITRNTAALAAADKAALAEGHTPSTTVNDVESDGAEGGPNP